MTPLNACAHSWPCQPSKIYFRNSLWNRIRWLRREASQTLFRRNAQMEKLQFRVLYRQFLYRVVDLELLSAQGDPAKLLGQFATVLLTFSCVVSVPLIFMGLGGAHRMPPESAWTFEHFLIATTMVVVGLFSVLSWDSAFPDRRDVLILSPLPVRARTLFLAKLAALGAGLSIAMFALNGLSGLLYPLLFTPADSGFLSVFRSLAAYWLTIVAAALFLFGSVLTMQGVASNLLPRQLFLRVSALLQVLTFCLFLSVYVLEPSLEARAALTAPENQRLLAFLPSYWFLGLFQQLNGSMEPAFIPLARRAWTGLAIVTFGTVTSVLLSYVHTMRRIVEEPDILPGSHFSLRWPRVTSSVDNAVLLFSLRTLLRSRQHRVVLSLYLGVGFAVMLVLLRPAVGKEGTVVAWLAVSILMLCVAAVAMRIVFSMPIAPRANWLFRLAALHHVATYSRAMRRTLLLLAVMPVWLSFAALFFFLLPWRIAAAHVVALGLLGSILADLCVWFSQDSLHLLLPARPRKYTVCLLGIPCAVAFHADCHQPRVEAIATCKWAGSDRARARRSCALSQVAHNKIGASGGDHAVRRSR
jgi:hypothetical protein